RTRRSRRCARCFDRLLRRLDDGLPDTLDLLLTEPCRGEQLLGAALRAAEDRGGLRTGPFERLLDLGARGIRELGRLVAGLLEQPAALRLGLTQLLRRVAVCIREQLPGLVAGVVQQLRPLPVALLAVALDL